MQLRSAHLDDVRELFALDAQPGLQLRHRGERVTAGEEDAELERRRVGVVGRLRAVDVVVGVQIRVLPALVPEDLQSTVSDPR